MKTSKRWRLGLGDMHLLSGSRHRSSSKGPVWIVLLVCSVSLFLLLTHIYPHQRSAACYIISSRGCEAISDWLPPASARELSDEEIATQVVFRNILKMPAPKPKTAKIAFMFLSTGSLPFERLWDMFFRGHEGKFTVYVHASREKPIHTSRYFVNRDIRSDKVVWGKISMVDAEKRLLANALDDYDNQHFVLLSDSCIPLHDFDYIYNYLLYSNVSYVDCFEDPGPHGNGRYSDHMLPEVALKDFRKAAQWFSIKRRHALVIMADYLYYAKFRDFCQPGLDGKNCYADEHYLPTFFHMIDPTGIANWSVTHVDWSEAKWHPKSYTADDVTVELLKNITSIDISVHVTSDAKKELQIRPCLWNGFKRPCYLFARKFLPETLDNLLQIFSNYTGVKDAATNMHNRGNSILNSLVSSVPAFDVTAPQVKVIKND